MNQKTTVIILTAVFIVLLGGAGYIYTQKNPRGIDREDSDQPSTAMQQTEELSTNGGSAAGTSPAGSPDAEKNDTPGNTPTQPPEGAEGSESSSNYTIDMRNFEFSIDQIKAKPGETITIELTNSGGTHNFVINELNVESDTINTGGNALVTFTIPEDAAGKSFAFYCSISSHRAQGMEGTLTIASN